jgi:uncharacterized protein (DUF1330 family)
VPLAGHGRRPTALRRRTSRPQLKRDPLDGSQHDPGNRQSPYIPNHTTRIMAKGYWITFYQSVSDPDRFAKYAALAGPAIEAGGGHFLARASAARTFEGGANQRVVVAEFESVGAAIAAYESPNYQAALKVLRGAVEREVRVVEGVG